MNINKVLFCFIKQSEYLMKSFLTDFIKSKILKGDDFLSFFIDEMIEKQIKEHFSIFYKSQHLSYLKIRKIRKFKKK